MSERSLPPSTTPDFAMLVASIAELHRMLAAHAARAVNMSLTLRNWLIGAYIREYEQQGADRAQYGEALLERLSRALADGGTIRYHPRELGRCRTFYATYPQIRGALSPESDVLPPALLAALPLPSVAGAAVVAGEIGIRGTLSPELAVSPLQLVQSLSFSHFAELLGVGDELQRRFYEVECLRGHWSVRELKRQIHSLYYQRSGLSTNKRELSTLTAQGAERAAPVLAIRDPYVFEFLGLTPQEVMSESHLEGQLIKQIEAFLLALGHGFCFEARQKRILIGDAYYFIDLVFYHRILKCHVLVELKLAEFTHENMGQLNTYVSWYRKNVMQDGDNPPIGLLLCTHKNQSLAEYALAGMDNQLFVSKYQLQLPTREDMAQFLAETLSDAEEMP